MVALPAFLVSLFKWFSGFLVASVIARVATFVVIAGLSQQFVGWLQGRIQTVAAGAPADVLAILERVGMFEFVGIILGAFGLAASLSWAFRPSQVAG